jgi:hypothetical protein
MHYDDGDLAEFGIQPGWKDPTMMVGGGGAMQSYLGRYFGGRHPPSPMDVEAKKTRQENIKRQARWFETTACKASSTGQRAL